MNSQKKISVGDIVKYRAWRSGDPNPDTVPKDMRSWESIGLVVELFRAKWPPEGALEESALVARSDTCFMECKISDLRRLHD
jgi:hypothetical protein